MIKTYFSLKQMLLSIFILSCAAYSAQAKTSSKNTGDLAAVKLDVSMAPDAHGHLPKADATLVLKVNGVAYDEVNLAQAEYGDEKLFSLETNNTEITLSDISFDLLDDYLDPYIDFSNFPYITAIKVGTSYVKITLAETDSYNSVSAIIGFEISRATQQITFDPLPIKTVGDADFELVATSNGYLPVSFSNSNSAVASVYRDAADGYKWKVKIKGKGQTVINAYNEGDENYTGAFYEQTLIVEEGTLGVTLQSYTIEKERNAVKLNWKTEAEHNHKTFVISRSHNGQQFEEIGTVNTPDAVSSLKTYNFYDRSPISGHSYYLLKQVDYDGKETELGIRTVDFSISSAQFQVYPNPASNNVSVSFEEGKYDKCVVSDLSGSVTQQIQIAPLQGNLEIDLADYPSGVYLISLSGNKNSITKKIVKK